MMKRTLISLLTMAAVWSLCLDLEGSVAVKPTKTKGEKIVHVAWAKALKKGRSKKRYYPEVASPYSFNKKVFVGTHSSIFYALNAEGKILWKFDSKGPIASQAISDENRVYFGNNKGMVYALEIDSGNKVWERYLGGEILAQPVLQKGTLYLVNTSREVTALDASNGNEKWSNYIRGYENRFTMRGNAAIALSNNKVFVGFADGQVACLSAGQGTLLWRQELRTQESFVDIDSTILIDGSSIFVTGYFGYLVKLNASSGSLIWKKELSSGVRLVMDRQSIYATSTEGKVLAFDMKSGVRQWEQPLMAGALSSPLLFDSYLLVGSEQGRAYLLDTSKGEVLQVLSLSSGYISDAIFDESSIYVLTNKGKLVSLSRNASI